MVGRPTGDRRRSHQPCARPRRRRRRRPLRSARARRDRRYAGHARALDLTPLHVDLVRSTAASRSVGDRRRDRSRCRCRRSIDVGAAVAVDVLQRSATGIRRIRLDQRLRHRAVGAEHVDGSHRRSRTGGAQPAGRRPQRCSARPAASHCRADLIATPRWHSRAALQRCEERELGALPRRASEPTQGSSAHHPTLPSRLTSSSFCASTANSIGSFCSTSRTKPLTSSATASSSGTPRARR